MKIIKRRHPHPEIPLVSTADVSFLLLIFFLSTTIFAAQRGITVTLPRPGESAVVALHAPVAEVFVASDSGVRLDGRALEAGALRDQLASRLRLVPDLIVRISIDPAAPYAALVAALDQVKLSGARRISLKTESAG
jgi:biopolymer transport protein ExbD